MHLVTLLPCTHWPYGQGRLLGPAHTLPHSQALTFSIREIPSQALALRDRERERETETENPPITPIPLKSSLTPAKSRAKLKFPFSPILKTAWPNAWRP